MRSHHLVSALVALATGSAYAQPAPANKAPQDPYAPAPKAPADPYAPSQPPPPLPTTPAPAPSPVPQPQDPVLAEQVASALVARAQELFDAKMYADAKQLAVETLVESPKGGAAEHARFLIKKINEQLGIKEEPKPEDKVDLTPIEDPTLKKDKETPLPPQPEVPTQGSTRVSASVHSAIYFGLLGATVGSFFDKDQPAGGAVPVGLAAGLAAGAYFPRVFDKLKWNEAQIRTAGAGTVWGGFIGGFFGHVASTESVTSRAVLVGASIGSTLGGIGGAALATKNDYTPGDIALVDTFAGMGAAGGLTLGMLMQPARNAAYSLNSVFGIAAGTVVGLVAAPQTNTTPRRMLRVAGLSAAGAAVPFLLYAGIHTSSSVADERVTGLLSTAGLVGGAWLGFYLTRDMDRDLDVLPHKKSDQDPPPSIIGRNSKGKWDLGMLTVQPLSPELSPQKGLAVPLLGGAF